MKGDERKRFCGDCKLHVYNLSDMTKYDAENLLRLSEGRLCVRYFQRPDGTVLTQDCPVGWARVKRRLSVAAAAAFGLFISFMGLLGAAALFARKGPVMGKIAFATPTPEPLMGAIAMPSPTPRVSPSPTPEGRWLTGDVAAPNKIDEELKRKVLRQSGI